MTTQRSVRTALLAATAAATLIAAAPLALAQSKNVRLRAGEHGEFSRIVLDPAPKGAWSASTRNRGLQLRFTTALRPEQVDTRQVVRKRMAHRVSGLKVSRFGESLTMNFAFNCDCEAKVSPAGGGKLVIDIRRRKATTPTGPKREAPNQTIARAPQAAPQDHKPLSIIPKGAGIEPPPPSTAEQIAQPAAPPPQARGADKPQPAQKPKEAPAQSAAAAPDGEEAKTIDVLKAREVLLRQLQRAADEGFISFKPDAPITEELAALPREETPPPKPHHEQAQGAAHLDGPDGAQDHGAAQGGVAYAEGGDHTIAPPAEHAAHTAPTGPSGAAPSGPLAHMIKRPKGPSSSAAKPDPLEDCTPERELKTASWGDKRGFTTGLSARRAQLYDTLNRVSPAAVEELMKFYLHHRLGEEALAAPKAYEVSTPKTRMLSHMADVLLANPPEDNSPFTRQITCGGLHSVWEAAAQAHSNPEAAMIADSAALDALAALPPDWRRLFGARIGLAAIKQGDAERAGEIMRLLRRTTGERPEEMVMLSAELAFVAGEEKKGRMELWSLVADRAPKGPEAAIRLSQRLKAPKETRTAKQVGDALLAYALQLRDSSLGEDVLEAYARLATRFGSIEAAASVLANEVERRPDRSEYWAQRRTEIARDAILAASAHPNAVVLAEAVRSAPYLDGSESSDKARIALSEALIAGDLAPLVPLVINGEAKERSTAVAQIAMRAQDAQRLEMPAAPTPQPQPEKPASTPEEQTEEFAFAREMRSIEEAKQSLAELGDALERYKELLSDG